jgi:hypothetical protein
MDRESTTDRGASMNEQEMLYLAKKIAEQSLGIKERVGRYIMTHSDQHRYDVVKQLIAINTAGNSIIEELNRYEFGTLETEKCLAISDMDTQGIIAIDKKRKR